MIGVKESYKTLRMFNAEKRLTGTRSLFKNPHDIYVEMDMSIDLHCFVRDLEP